MKNITRFFTICILLLISIMLQGQNIMELIDDKVPASPNAAALGLFGGIPVGHYTGTPSISIPIYEIDLDGKKIPINISYHASGIRVNQEASWVGLGWALNAGGMITRQVNGGIDFGQAGLNGYYWDTQMDYYLQYENDWGAMPNRLNFATYTRTHDLEPDLYNFNFSSYSGVMFTGKINTVGNTATIAKGVVRMPKEYLDISFFINDNKWIIYDGAGFTYYFSSDEKTTTWVKNVEGTGLDLMQHYVGKTHPDRKSLMTGSLEIPEQTSSWLLDSIKSSNNSIVRFIYDYDYIYTTISFSEYYNKCTGVKRIGEVNTPVEYRSIYSNTYSYSKIRQARLRKIAFEEGEINFQTSDRLDLEAVDSSIKAQKLDKIIITNKENDIIKEVLFSYDYMGNITSNYTCRLLLSGITENNTTNHAFTYNTGTLPPKHSFKTDFWGYYNGALDYISTSSPRFCNIPGAFYQEASFKYQYIPGSDKSSNDYYMKYGILTEIQYPTKGKSQLVYEPHDYPLSEYDISSIKVEEKAVIAYALDDESDLTAPGIPDRDEESLYSNTFMVNKDQANAVVRINASLAHFANQPDPATVGIKLEKLNGNNFETVPIGDNGVLFQQYLIGQNYKESYRATLPLQAGVTYRLVMEKNSSLNYYSIVCRLLCETINVGAKGGGLRIKEIKNQNEGKEDIRSYIYQYPNNSLSGESMIRPWYHRYLQIETVYGNDSHEFAVFFEANSQSYIPLSYAAQGSPVGYSYVRENIGNEGGYTVYKFHNKKDSLIMTEFPFSQIPSVPDFKNGLLINTSIYNQQNEIVDSTRYSYERLKTNQVKGLKICNENLTYAEWSENAFHLPAVLAYQQSTETWRIQQEEKTTIHNGTKAVTLKNHLYDPVYSIKKEENFINSDGDLVRNLYNYSFDKNDAINVAMKNKHIVETPIEEITIKNNIVSSAYKAIYKDTLGIFVPDQVLSSYKRGATLSNYADYYQTEAQFYNYNVKGKSGNVVYKTKPNTVYLWGYNGQYMIAAIQNATYNEVRNQLGDNFIQALSQSSAPSLLDWKIINGLRRNLPNASITTFMYKPLVGLTSTTNPHGIPFYYEYDPSGRLKNQRDRHGNIIESYNYQYK